MDANPEVHAAAGVEYVGDTVLLDPGYVGARF
jgi:hypothetical protein